MQNEFKHLLSPLRIGNMLLKNRITSTSCLPHFLQGPETFPSESIITFVEGLARSGAAIVTVPDRFDNTRSFPMQDVCRAPCWDTSDPSVSNYLSHMVEAVHFQGSYLIVQLSKFKSIPSDAGVYDHMESPGPAMMASLDPPPPKAPVKQITEEQMRAVIEEVSSRCLYYKSFGCDGICLHFAYSYNVPAKFLSSETNKRTDEYGGPIENRARFPLSIVRAVREACGEDFYIELQISGDCMPEEELIRFARMCEGLADTLQLRRMDMDDSHMTPYNYDGVSIPGILRYAELIKNAGVGIAVAPAGGFHDPRVNDRIIAEGRADLIAMARPLICEAEYTRKLEDGRPEDIMPCLHCNRCHDHIKGKWASFCANNPYVGIAHRIEHMMPISGAARKNVAVVGGGPAGMRAALLIAEKGCIVTLYEASGALGGQLRHSDYPQFKWAVRKYKDYLIAQVEKHGSIKICLGTAATPQMISEAGYDAVVTALGASPKLPEILGIDGAKVWMPLDVYGHEGELGRRVVVVGGSESGTETGLYLAEAGHDVTVLTRNRALAQEAWCVHAYSLMQRRWMACDNFHGITRATTSAIADGSVTYIDDSGTSHVLECDDVVVCGGVKPLLDEAASFAGCAAKLINIGDSNRPGNIQTCNRGALSAAARL